jgi:catechol 2,3-dioxygenase-like lactoylglutathione lyase family enzyme
MGSPRIDHVSVTASDLERSVAFYRDVLGLTELGRGEADEPELSDLLALADVRVRWAELDLGAGQILELLEYRNPLGDPLEPSPNRPGATHLGLGVEDIGSYRARLADAGALISPGVVTLTEDTDWKGTLTLYARDPDGVTIELVERTRRVVVLPEAEEPSTAATEPR